MSATRKYRLTCDLWIDGEFVPTGALVELSDERAAELAEHLVVRSPGATEPAGEVDEAEAVNEADEIVAAIGQLNPENPDHWTKAGKPDVAALEAILDRDISADDRDAAWQRAQDVAWEQAQQEQADA